MDEDEHLPTRKKPKPKLLGRGGGNDGEEGGRQTRKDVCLNYG